MDNKNETKSTGHYTVVELPLSDEDVKKLNKDLSASYKVNLLLLPLLALIYFWGLLYFGVFAIFVIVCNVIFAKNYSEIRQELRRPKIVLTGNVTAVNKNEETVLYVGPDRFDITYANVPFPIAVGETISLHYSIKADRQRSRLLNVEKRSLNTQPLFENPPDSSNP